MMTEDTLEMREDDRLPWLEAVEEDEDDGVGLGKLLLMALAGLAVVAVVIAAIMYVNGGNRTQGDGELIAAPEQDYRVRPSEAGGMEVEGEGDASFAASEGETPVGRIDPTAVPEQPVQGRRASAPANAPPSAGSSTARIPPSSQRLAANDRQPAASSGSGASPSSGRLIQLGAFSSEAAANRAWQTLSGKYAYIGSFEKHVSSVEAGGRTLYRLRAAAASSGAARQACDRLRVATEDCSVVVN